VNPCEYCRRDLDESEVRVCSSCDAHEFDLAKGFVEAAGNLLSQHPAAARNFSRCRTTKDRVERGLADFLALVEVMSDYVRCGGTCP